MGLASIAWVDITCASLRAGAYVSAQNDGSLSPFLYGEAEESHSSVAQR